MFILLGIVVIVYLSFHSASGTETESERGEGGSVVVVLLLLRFDKSMIRRLIRLAEETRCRRDR